jgi:predicted RNA-binding Zn ribbon-like protein
LSDTQNRHSAADFSGSVSGEVVHTGNTSTSEPCVQLVNCLLMETPSTPSSRRPPGIRELPIVAGHLALDFANTVDDPLGPERFDHVADYPGLVAWSERVGTVSPEGAAGLRRAAASHPRRAAATVRQAAALRAALNDIFGALVDGRSPDAGWTELRPFVVSALQQARLTSPGARALPTWDMSEVASPLWPVAEAAYQLLTEAEPRRLKRCVACPWLFLDRSKNHSRRWCSMEICGTDEKVRRYVSTRAQRRAR